MALIFVLSSRPASGYPDAGLVAQKGMHVMLYATLGILLWRALRASGLNRRNALLLAWLGATLYGASDEFHQTFTPTRHGSPVDVGIDASGALLGLALASIFLTWYRRQKYLSE
ncbi:MAG: VanZ family protein [Dehalococcoidales bacterium]|nr:VanZ family protein [Dehalococcoidales bacterium]